MRSKIRSMMFGAFAMAATAAPASSQFSTGALPGNAYITFGGINWAWAYPLPAASGGFTLAGQSAFGWRLPTAAELAGAPLATDFLFGGGNVPFGGTDGGSGASFSATNGAYTSDGACATPWFSTVYYHCDWQDGLGQTYGPWAGMTGAFGFADQLVVQDVAVEVVPEPGTMSLMAIGIAGLVARRRRRRA